MNRVTRGGRDHRGLRRLGSDRDGRLDGLCFGLRLGRLRRRGQGTGRRRFGKNRSVVGRPDVGLGLGVELFDAGGAALFVARVLAATRQIRFEVVGPNQVFDVKERGALLADVDEGGLKPGQHAGHAPEVNASDGASTAALAFSLDEELGDDAVFNQRDAGLTDVDVDDQYILGHAGVQLSRPNA